MCVPACKFLSAAIEPYVVSLKGLHVKSRRLKRQSDCNVESCTDPLKILRITISLAASIYSLVYLTTLKRK